MKSINESPENVKILIINIPYIKYSFTNIEIDKFNNR